MAPVKVIGAMTIFEVRDSIHHGIEKITIA
jgi:hypothetical protein